MMKNIPVLIKCTECGNIVNRGKKIKYRCKCNQCKSYIYLWNVREFYRAVNGSYIEVEYESLKDRIMLVKRLHDIKR